MNRVPSILREAAATLSSDFDGALAVRGGWRMEVSDDFVLSVAAGDREEAVLLSDEVYDEEWFDRDGSDEERHEALLLDATEALGHELFEVLRLWDLEKPHCGQHAVTIGVCEGVWFCPRSHDVRVVGALTAEDVAPART